MPQRNEDGFTITELIVAIVFTITVLPAIAGLITSINFINKKSDDSTMINNLAAAKIDGLRSAGYANLSDGLYDFTLDLPAQLPQPRSGTYTVSTESANVKKIELTISYTVQGQTQSFNFTTLISDGGLGQFSG